MNMMSVLEFADKYGIRVKHVDGPIPRKHRLPNTELGLGCIPEKRLVMVDWRKQRENNLQGKDELLLHELIHVIVQPPHMDIREVPELAILLQFEHAVGRYLMSDIYEAIEHFQMPTDVKLRGRGREYTRTFRGMVTPALRQDWLERPEPKCKEHQLVFEHPHFLRGQRFCKRLGILDEGGHPIVGQYPQWKGNLAAFRRLCARVQMREELPINKRHRKEIAKLQGDLSALEPKLTGHVATQLIIDDPKPGLFAQGTLVPAEGYAQALTSAPDAGTLGLASSNP